MRYLKKIKFGWGKDLRLSSIKSERRFFKVAILLFIIGTLFTIKQTGLRVQNPNQVTHEGAKLENVSTLGLQSSAPSGELKDISKEPGTTHSYSYQMPQNTSAFFVRKNEGNPSYEVKKDDLSLSFTLNQKAKEVRAEGNRVEYLLEIAEMPVKMRLTTGDDRVKEEFVIEQKPDQKVLDSLPEELTLPFSLESKNLSFKENDGAFIFSSKDNQTNWLISKPTILDNQGKEGQTHGEIKDNRYNLIINTSLLKTGAYPIIIDPTIIVSTSGATTYNAATQNSPMRHIARTSDGTLHAFIQMNTNTTTCGSDGLWWLYSTDSGDTWTCGQQIAAWNTASRIMSADARVDSSDNIYIVYSVVQQAGDSGANTVFDVYYRKLTKGVGANWTVETAQKVLDGSASVGYTHAVLELEGTTRIWLATRYYDGSAYQVSAYYSDGLEASPTWTVSQSGLGTGDTDTVRYPAITRFGSKIGVFYTNRWGGGASTFAVLWRFRSDGDPLTSWSEEGKAGGANIYTAGYNVIGDSSGHIYLARNSWNTGNFVFNYYNGSSWSADINLTTTGSNGANSGLASVATDGTNAWIFYGETSGLSGGLSGYAKLVYKKCAPPFTTSDCDATATPVVSYHTTFDKYWSYVASAYTDDTTDAGNTTSADTQIVTSSGDIAYFGKTETFDAISWDVSTAGNSGGAITWEYCSAVDVNTACTTWSSLSFTSQTSAAASDFEADGYGAFTAPGDWVAAKVNSEDTAYYYIRARATASYTTSPVGVQVAAIPQISNSSVTGAVVSNSLYLIWTENAASPTRVRFTSVSVTASTANSASTAGITPQTAGYSSTTAATAPSTQRHIIRTSDGTLHAFVQAGTQLACGGQTSNNGPGLNWLYSTDSGATWTCGGQISSDTTNLMYADAKVDSSDNIYVVYSVATTSFSASYDVFYRKLTKGSGATWTVGDAQTVLDSTSTNGYGYSYATAELQGTTRLWLAARQFLKGWSINAIGWNGSYFLVGGEGGKLAKFDGTTWTDLTSSANFGTTTVTISSIAWNSTDSYWLIGGGDLDGATGLTLLKYDGTDFTDLTSSMSGWTAYPIQAIAYNSTNNYFLIGGGDKDNATVSRLNKYDGSTFTDLSSSLSGFADHPVDSIAWNSTDNYFLIGGGDADACTASSRLNKYDGSTFTDLSSSLSGFSNCPVLATSYNPDDNYFLIGGGDADTASSVELNKYDGTTFTDLSGSVTGFSNYAIQSITYNSTDNYFLIGGGDDDGASGSFLNKYDGSTFTNLASSLSNFNSTGLMAVTWGSSYALIGSGFLTTGNTANGLNKYDGTTFTDLKPDSLSVFGDGYYRVTTYYSDGLGTSPTWTQSMAALDTLGTSSNRHYPAIVRFGSNIGVIYNNDGSNINWRFRADSDSLTSWTGEGLVIASTPTTATFSTAGNSQGNVFFATNTGTSVLFTYWNGSAWSPSATISSAAVSSGFTSVSTDGNANVWVVYGETTGLSGSLSGSRKLVYKKGTYPFTANDFDTSSTPLVSQHTTFNTLWLYDASADSYCSESTDAGDTDSTNTSGTNCASVSDIGHSDSSGMVKDAGDIIYFGQSNKFDAISYDLGTAASSDGRLAWEYWNGSSWIQLTDFLALSNTTFGGDGYLTFIPHSDWATTMVNGEETAYYYIRARVTTAYSTAPVGIQFAAIPQINWANITPSVASDTIYTVWTENAASPARIRYSSFSVVTSTAPASTSGLSPATIAYSSSNVATGPSTEKSFVRTSDGTLHAFVQGGTSLTCGNSTSSNNKAGLNWLYSTDSGATWTCGGQLSSDTSNLMNADARVDSSDNIYVVYSVGTANRANAYDVFYRKLTKGSGASWTVGDAQTVLDGSATGTGYHYATVELEGTTRMWLATRYFDGTNYGITAYYSDDLGTAPTWTQSVATLDTAGTVNYLHEPTIVRFGSKIGVIYQDNDNLLKWRYRADSDTLTSWSNQTSLANTNGPQAPYFTAIGTSSGYIYALSSNTGCCGVDFYYYNGSVWNRSYTFSSSGASYSRNYALSTDGNNVWIFYGDTTNISLGYYNKLYYRKGVAPFTSSDFSSATALTSYHGNFDKVWTYISSSYTDDTTDAGNTTSADVAMPSAVGDIAYFGKTEKFDNITWDLSTNGSGGVVTWEYYNGSSWVPITTYLTTSNVTFGGDGYVSFEPNSDWATTTINGEETAYYYIRARVTTAYSTAPVGVDINDIPSTVYIKAVPTVASDTIPVIWTENNTSNTRIRFVSASVTAASSSPSSTSAISPTIAAYSSITGATSLSTMRHIVKTSDGTLHAFVQAGTLMACGNQAGSNNTGLNWVYSTDKGSTWTCGGALLSTNNLSFYADAKVDSSDNIYVVYSLSVGGASANNDVYYQKLTKGAGSTWTIETAQKILDASASTSYEAAVIELQGTTRLWLATRYYNGTNFQISVYYSDGLSASPTWTQSVATLDTAGNNNAYHFPTIVRFGSNIGIIWNDQGTSGDLLWRTRADSDGLTTWNTAATISTTYSVTAATFSAVGDTSGNVYLAANDSTVVYFSQYLSSWSSIATVSSAAASDAFVSVGTDGANVWVVYGETTGLSSGLSGSRKLVYKKGISPFATGDFDSTATAVVPYHTTFDKVWTYISSPYTDDTTDAGNTTSADIAMPSAVGDIIYLGKTVKFDSLSYDLSTNGSGGVVDWEYYNGSTWMPLTTYFAVSNTTFGGDGYITFNPHSDWAATRVNGETTDYYYIRARVTTAYSTPPVGVQFAAIPQISWANVAPGVLGDKLYILWTENAASTARIRFRAITFGAVLIRGGTYIRGGTRITAN